MSLNYYGTIVMVAQIFNENKKFDKTVDFDYNKICINSIVEVIEDNSGNTTH